MLALLGSPPHFGWSWLAITPAVGLGSPPHLVGAGCHPPSYIYMGLCLSVRAAASSQHFAPCNLQLGSKFGALHAIFR